MELQECSRKLLSPWQHAATLCRQLQSLHLGAGFVYISELLPSATEETCGAIDFSDPWTLSTAKW